MMKKNLENFKWLPGGARKSCLEYLGLKISDAWNTGALAFVMNINREVSAYGPERWWDGNSGSLEKINHNIGCYEKIIQGGKKQKNFAQIQAVAWEMVKNAIDNRLPCYGWELEKADYYIITGYDDVGYYYAGPGCETGKGPKSWRELGDTPWGWLEIHIVKTGPVEKDIVHLRDTFEFVLTHAGAPTGWIQPGFRSGLKGFDRWIRSLEKGAANGWGMAYNAHFWSEKRSMAVDFLKESKERIRGKFDLLFDEVIKNYISVSENLKKVAELFPLKQENDTYDIENAGRRQAAVNCLKIARNAEARGLKNLADFIIEIEKHLYPDYRLCIKKEAKNKEARYVSITRLPEDDIPGAAKLYIKLANQIKDSTADPYYNFDSVPLKRMEAYLRSDFKNPSALIYIAKDNEQIIGIAVGIVRRCFLGISKIKKVGYLSEAYVSPAYRNMGIIKKMEGLLLDFFKKKGVSYVELSVLSKNEEAKKTWSALGYETYNEHMRKKL
jgi:ribosomal protein S18 acetylase RimI-like enzyme